MRRLEPAAITGVMSREVAKESLRRITAWGVQERRRRVRDVFSNR